MKVFRLSMHIYIRDVLHLLDVRTVRRGKRYGNKSEEFKGCKQ